MAHRVGVRAIGLEVKSAGPMTHSRSAPGFGTASNFIAIAYLRMAKFKHLTAHPFARAQGIRECRVPHKTA